MRLAVPEISERDAVMIRGNDGFVANGTVVALSTPDNLPTVGPAGRDIIQTRELLIGAGVDLVAVIYYADAGKRKMLTAVRIRDVWCDFNSQALDITVIPRVVR